MAKKDPRTDVPELEDDEELPEVETTNDDIADRDEELSGMAGVSKALLKIYDDIAKGFDDQRERSDDQMDYWDLYNCVLNNKQFYTGNSQIFVPIVRSAVDARKTRFVNQIFPQTGRYVECISSDDEKPFGIMSLLEHYIRKARLRTQIMPALMKNGDVEGQYSIYVTWRKTKRYVVQRIQRETEIDTTLDPQTGDKVSITDPDNLYEDVEEEEIVHGAPMVEVLADSDILVLPQTCDSLEEAIAVGGSVSIMRRWSKTTIKKMMRDGSITKSEGGKLLKEMNKDETQSGARKPDKAKEMVDAAGIKRGARGTYALVYETWTELMVGDQRRLCRAFFGGPDNVLGCKLNPNWADHLPIISAPVNKVQGAFKGASLVKPAQDLQYYANDTINEAADSGTYSLLPIIMTDPQKNPRIGSMILSMAAIWETDPASTQFAKFPEMWKDGLNMVASVKAEIFQLLSVNPAAISPSMSQHGKKQNQAEVAQAQQVDILTTSDSVTVLEEGILTPLLQRMVELDHQYRDKDLTVAQYGAMGRRANMEDIPPVQFNRHYQFKWLGVEAARQQQQIQQQIAAVNVVRGIPPEQLQGRKLNLVPVVESLIENTFGPRLSPLIFPPIEDEMPVPVAEENMMLSEGFKVPVHMMDDDDQHIQAHMMAMKTNGGEGAKQFQTHIWLHMQQKAKKQQAQAAAQQMAMQGAPGVPGGAGPGVAGTPRPGAQPGQQRPAQQPPGAIHQDRMPLSMPRNM